MIRLSGGRLALEGGEDAGEGSQGNKEGDKGGYVHFLSLFASHSRKVGLEWHGIYH